MIYLNNAFSLGMVAVGCEPVCVRCAAEDVPADAISVVGHQDVAGLFADILNCPVAFNRQSVCIGESDAMYVGQYIGPRLPEGCTALPDGARFEWWLISAKGL